MHEDEARPIHTSLEDLAPELARRAETELDRSERIVWVGQPRPDLYAKASGFMFVMGIFFTAQDLSGRGEGLTTACTGAAIW